MNSASARLLPLLLTLFMCAGFEVQAQEAANSGAEILTNETVLKMVRASLSPIIVVSKIRTSKTNFNLSTDELIRLQQEKVPDEIIKGMVDSATSEATRPCTHR